MKKKSYVSEVLEIKVIIAWKRTTPMNTSDLNSYISIKFVVNIIPSGG